MWEMHDMAERSRALVAAIKTYEQEHHRAPDSLHDLVPKYIGTIPSTGLRAYPTYEYHSENDARQYFDGNPWALSVFTPSGGINFDMMLYLPEQNYPLYGYGGWLERISDWAYVHE